MSDDRAMVYEDNGTIVYRASSFGGCDTALVAARLNYPASSPPEKLQQVFDAGNAAEEWVTRDHLPVIRAQEEVRLEIQPGVEIRGHIDGIHPHPAYDAVVEIKSQSDKAFNEWTENSWTTDPLWMKYAWQASIYMIVTRKDLYLVRANREAKALAGQLYTRPFWLISDIRNRAYHLEGLADSHALPECTAKSWGCPYYQLHEQDEVVADEELDAACANYKWAQHAEKLAKEVTGNAKARVIEVLRGRPKVSTFGGYSVKLSTFKKDEHTVKASEQTRLTITEAK